MPHVQINLTSSGYLPTLCWGEGEDMDREAYSMSFADVATADRIGRGWAEEQGVEFRPYRDMPPMDPRFAPLVRRLREEKGLELRDAIEQAKAQLAADPIS